MLVKKAIPNATIVMWRKICLTISFLSITLVSNASHAELALVSGAAAVSNQSHSQRESNIGEKVIVNARSDDAASSATSSAKYGILKVGASGNLTNLMHTDDLNYSLAVASFSDEVTIATSQYPDGWELGGALTYFVNYTVTARNPRDTEFFPANRVTGGAEATLTAYANVDPNVRRSGAVFTPADWSAYTVRLISGEGPTYYHESSDPFDSGQVGFFNGYITINSTIRNNVPFQLDFVLTAFGATNDLLTSGVNFYSIDALHSAYWAGAKVTADGVPVNDFSIAGASGTDYSHSMVPADIPEPSILAIFAIGVIGLATARRTNECARDPHR